MTETTPTEAPSSSRAPFHWRRLLAEIHLGRVIPIVGPELLPYHHSLAPELARQLKVPAPAAEATIVAVADTYARHSKDPRRVGDILEELLDAQHGTTEPLRELVAIDAFRLIVTTDYASLIETALRERGDSPKTLTFTLGHGVDDIDGYPDADRYVYHLLGHHQRFGSIALARVDQLEYLYGLQRSEGPTELLYALSQKANLLFLGCDFPEWLASVLTRTLLGKALHQSKERGIEVIACRAARETRGTGSFTAFLRDNNVEVYDGDAQSFVHELCSRYRQFRDTLPKPPPVPDDGPTGGVAFISYLRSDRELSKAFVNGLRRRGLSAWIDEQDVRSSAEHESSIRAAIREGASAFVVLITPAMLEAPRAYLYREWEHAAWVQDELAGHIRFIFPVLIGDVDPAVARTWLERNFPRAARMPLERFEANTLSEQLIEDLGRARDSYEQRIPDGFTFISYRREDADDVRLMAQFLRGQAIDNWLDEQQLAGGTDFEHDINVTIRERCSAFIAVISNATLNTDSGFFFREWSCANWVRDGLAKSAKFVFPILVGDVDINRVRRWLASNFPAFAPLHIERFSDGKLSPQLLDALRTARKDFQRRQRDRFASQ